MKKGAFAALFMQWELEEQGTPDGESAKEKTAKEKHSIDEKYDHRMEYNVLISTSDLSMHDKLCYHVEAYHPTVPTPPPLV